MNESDLPLFPEVRVGWRSWNLENGRLYSVTQSGYGPSVRSYGLSAISVTIGLHA
jgi:hypothetical protein